MAKDQELLQAVKSNDIGTVRKILAKVYSAKSKKGSKSKYNLNIQDEDGFTSLHHTSLTGNTEIAMALLDMECNVNARDRKGMSPLHLASWAGKTEVAKLLIQARSCVNLCADSGETPLHLACQHANVGVVEILLGSNADAAVINKNGESALDLACRFGHLQVVDLLLRSEDCEKLLSLYEENPKSADPPLHISCKTGREEIVMLLLDAGADVNQSGANGTALHEAALYGKTDVVKILLDAMEAPVDGLLGAPPRSRGMTSSVTSAKLEKSISREGNVVRRPNLGEVVLEHGADVSITNEEGYTPLDLVQQFTSSRASADIKNLLRDARVNKRVTAKALRDYCNIYDPTCLSFKAGEVIEILEQNETGRWKGKTTIGKKEVVGYFPASMVKLANPRKASVRTSLMRDAAVLPVGKYEMVTLPNASQSSPLASRPRMSSFGKPGNKSFTPPSSRDDDDDDDGRYSPVQAPVKRRHETDPIANGLKDSELFKKNKQSLQYVEVSVEQPLSSPSSPSSTASSSSKTQYAEVVLPPSANGVSEEDEEEQGRVEVPQLPQKQSQRGSSEDELDSDIWVPRKESGPKPQLPPKIRREEDEVFRDPPYATVAPSLSPTPPEPARTSPEPSLQPRRTSPQPPQTSPQPTRTTPEPTRTSPGPRSSSPVVTRLGLEASPVKIHSPELSRKGYEDMNLSSPEKEEQVFPLKRPPPRVLDFRSPIPQPADRRQIAYENVEVKTRSKAKPPQSMLITEVDQTQGIPDEEYVTVTRGVGPVSPTTPNKHRYENVATEFDLSSAPNYETMDQTGDQNYENMERNVNNSYEPTPAGYVPMKTQPPMDNEPMDLRRDTDMTNDQAYENVAIKPKTKAQPSGIESSGYVPMNDPLPATDYININVPSGTSDLLSTAI